MLVNKITSGFVIQTFDTELNKFVNQEFIANDEVTIEDQNGESVNNSTEDVILDSYFPFEMKQPENNS